MGSEIKNYKDLLVWQRGMDLAVTVYNLSKKLPKGEQFGLTSQLKRASASVPSNIAEGYGRQSTGSYKQFLSISRGSLLELETQILLCIRLGFLEPTDADIILEDINILSKMLSSLIIKLQ